MPRKSQANESVDASRTHHERHCSICRHPEREAIEEQFAHWHNPTDIAFDFKVERRALYRHAHALNLFALRDRHLRHSLGHIIQRAQNVKASADSVIRAVHAYTRVNHVGEWVEPPAHVIVSSGTQIALSAAAAHALAAAQAQPLSPAAAACAPEKLPLLLDTTSRVENDPSL